MIKTMMYKSWSGAQWRLCKVIAEYEDRVWLHNLETGSMPVVRKEWAHFKDASEYIEELQG